MNTMNFKQYTVTETLDAFPMNRFEYNNFKGWKMPEGEDPDTQGYLISYPDGKTSWREKELFDKSVLVNTCKTMGNTDASGTKVNVKDVVFWGDGDAWKLLGKASSKNEDWMKSSKAMEIQNEGCLVQVTTQQGSNVAEAVTFVPDVKILETKDDKGAVVSRKLVSIYPVILPQL